ncbi:hypothetical protein ABFV05_006328 [Capra hircus]
MAAFDDPAKPLLSLNPQEDAKFKKEVAQVCLPPSLYETQIRAGNSKGYGFVELESEDVAKIAAETMNSCCERLLKCHFTPPEKLWVEEWFKKEEKLLRKRLAKKRIDYSFHSLVKVLHKNEENASNTVTPNTPEKVVDHQGPTPICTPTFLEKQKSEVAKMNDDDKENEIVFKQPISGEKEETQETQLPTSSRKQR